MKIPKSGSHWENRDTDKLTSCYFDMFITKVDETQEEFDGSARKQTKQDTIAEGFKHTFNAQAAANLVGKKFVISSNGQPLHLTTLPTDVLRQIPLPAEYEAELNGGANSSAPTSSAFGGFAAISKAGGASSDNEGRRLGMAAKRLFMGLGAALEVVYADDESGLVICEVVDVAKKPEAFISMIEGVFDSGEHPDGHDHFKISFGLLKEIK